MSKYRKRKENVKVLTKSGARYYSALKKHGKSSRIKKKASKILEINLLQIIKKYI